MNRHNLYAEISGTIITPLSLQPLHLATTFGLDFCYHAPIIQVFLSPLNIHSDVLATCLQSTSILLKQLHHYIVHLIGAPPPSTPSLEFKMLIT